MVFPDLLERSAALLHGVLVWRPLQLWNTGLAWAAAFGLLTRNGFDLEISAWEQMVITEEITNGTLDDVAGITSRLVPTCVSGEDAERPGRRSGPAFR